MRDRRDGPEGNGDGVVGYRLGIDVGGTFTDFVLLHEGEWRMWTDKQLTTPAMRAGVPLITPEHGGGADFYRGGHDQVAGCVRGITNVMRHLEMLSGRPRSETGHATSRRPRSSWRATGSATAFKQRHCGYACAHWTRTRTGAGTWSIPPRRRENRRAAAAVFAWTRPLP
jgi:hypothetical protein